uniref:Uncharacterized protein n=1 Tax=Anguilla anguilla TaxID=7936 RepID=A0A0E9XN80_ANGAN
MLAPLYPLRTELMLGMFWQRCRDKYTAVTDLRTKTILLGDQTHHPVSI